MKLGNTEYVISGFPCTRAERSEMAAPSHRRYEKALNYAWEVIRSLSFCRTVFAALFDLAFCLLSRIRGIRCCGEDF